MKKITFLIAMLFLAHDISSQVSLDAEYDDDLTIVKFADLGDKIVVIDKDNNHPRVENTIVRIYNLDNSLFKTIDIGSTDDIADVSQKLVNTDDKIEIMIDHYDTSGSANQGYFYIINEDLEEVFRSELGWNKGESALRGRYFDDQLFFQTSEGIKMILENSDNNKTRVYSLGGDITLSNRVYNIEDSIAFPNPSKEMINIPYTAINDEIVEIKIFDINGKIIDSKKADKQFDKIKLNISNYSQGVYLYSVKNSLGVNKGKFIKK